jgi:hypothetical protein
VDYFRGVVCHYHFALFCVAPQGATQTGAGRGHEEVATLTGSTIGRAHEKIKSKRLQGGLIDFLAAVEFMG